MRKYLETNENGNTACQKRRDAAKAVLRGKFIATSTYVKKNTACGIGCSSRVLFYCSIVDLQHCANLWRTESDPVIHLYTHTYTYTSIHLYTIYTSKMCVCVYIYICFIFFSIMVYHWVLNTVPSATCSFHVPQWTWNSYDDNDFTSLQASQHPHGGTRSHS